MGIITKYGITGEEAMVESYGRCLDAGCPAGVNSDYRNPVTQVYLFEKNYTPDYSASSKRDKRSWKNISHWRRSLYQDHVSVAVPGTSLHEKGLALDLPGDKNNVATPRGWMHRHGAPFGFIWPDWAQRPATYEPWHLEYEADKDEMEEEMAFTDDDRALLKEVRNLVRPGKEGEYSDGALASLVREARNAGKSAESAVKEFHAAFSAQVEKERVSDHTPTTTRMMETAGYTPTGVLTENTGAYAQAAALTVEQIDKKVDTILAAPGGVDPTALKDVMKSVLIEVLGDLTVSTTIEAKE